ncbi:MAG TPA: glutamine--fructose-6-phosphate transaminase (isomerizing) [Candidatus Bathyarchaeia archaeon]|nr:glutamine--fructose-6-phosphate transaminase (isomerizing) [Candidatus Bathyarchaeia archaeon]
MCGIFGCILDGGDRAAPIIHSALNQLEYRGYDSVGEATIHSGHLYVKKDVGKISEVHSSVNLDDMPGSVGIGHTRWATHGAPTQKNAHPHTDCQEKIALVHNGIIQNFAELRKELEGRGHLFKSNTDTEVMPHLIEDYFKEGLSFSESVRRALLRVKGSYAIAAISVDDPNTIICARKESPLVIGVGKSANYLASDIPAFLPMTKMVLFLEEEEMAVLKRDGVTIFNIGSGDQTKRDPMRIEWTVEMAQKGGKPHFMLKEIAEQPLALQNALRGELIYYNLMATILAKARNIILLACGTSSHACIVATYLFSKLAHVNSSVSIASEFMEQFGNSVDEGTVVLAVSQSGETADTLSAIRSAKDKGATILGITNVMGSSLTRLASVYIGQNSGPEIAVAATKTFTSQVLILSKLAIALAEKRGTIRSDEIDSLMTDLGRIPWYVKKELESNDEKIKRLAAKYRDRFSFCFLGRGLNVATALEGRLKLLELAYTPSLAYSAGESKHGFIALVNENYPVIFIAPNDDLKSRLIGNIMEMKARGADIIAITEEKDKELQTLADDWIEVPKGINPLFTPIVYAIPLQLFAYHVSVMRGHDPDRPRNLAKSVTVE